MVKLRQALWRMTVNTSYPLQWIQIRGENAHCHRGNSPISCFHVIGEVTVEMLKRPHSQGITLCGGLCRLQFATLISSQSIQFMFTNRCERYYTCSSSVLLCISRLRLVLTQKLCVLVNNSKFILHHFVNVILVLVRLFNP